LFTKRINNITLTVAGEGPSGQNKGYPWAGIKGSKEFFGMSDNQVKTTNDGADDEFATLFASSENRLEKKVRIGDRIRAEIITIGEDTIFVDTGTKIDGVVEKGELLDEAGNFPFNDGDTLDLYVVAVSENEIRLSRALSGSGAADLGMVAVRDAFEQGVPVEGKVKGTCKGGFNIEIMGRRSFCPISQIDLIYVEQPEDYVGKSFIFAITQFEEQGRNIVVSRKALLKKAQAELRDKFLETLEKGAVVEGRVTKLMPFGAFVEIGPGVEGMAHVSELAWTRVEKPEDILTSGETVKVKVISIEDSEKGIGKKIGLSIKQLSGDPWSDSASKFSYGDKIVGKVTKLMPFGAFVEICPGVEGLVHISEFSHTRRINRPEDMLSVGDEINVAVKEVDVDKKRISLSIKDAEGDPWSDVAEKFKVGQVVEGKVEGVEKFGIFISIDTGITGLLPMSSVRNSSRSSELEKLSIGDKVTVMIREIRGYERKITLSPGDGADDDDWRKFARDSDESPSVGGGALAEKLREALKSS
jgi:small subunit ribosomal protein S1